MLPALLSELVNGSPDPSIGTFMLNRGDRGLLYALDRISAEAASKTATGGATIAAHTDHVRYGLELLNRWAGGETSPWKTADWTASWRKQTVTDAEWRRLRDDLRREAEVWQRNLGTLGGLSDTAMKWVAGSVAHLAYHLGAIRQIDRATRGPTAEDERAVSLASPHQG
ncbi:MAG TPA: hypothetical protein VGP95_16920 [Gemmatimonadaceae bacterium]|nr:hypothetical protein [Gemmatimonadaceae bacterium]